MSDANRTSIAFIEETTWGVTPGTPVLKALRITKEGIIHNKSTVVSEEVRPDRQVGDLVEVGVNGGGSFSFELSYTDFLVWFRAAMSTTAVAINITGLTATLTASTGTIVAAGGTWANVIPGCFVRIQGFTNPLNNVVAMVLSKTNTDLVFGAAVFAADQTGATISVKGTQLKNGTERPSFTLERKVPKTGGYDHQQFTGMCVDTLDIAMESMKIITGDVGYVGKTGGYAASITASPYTAAASDPVMNATSNVANIRRGPGAMAERAKSFSLSIKNGLRAKDAMGEKGAFDVGQGEFNVTGSINVYFEDNALFQLFVDHTPTNFSWSITDRLGNAIWFHLPNCQFSAGNVGVSAKNTDNMQQMDFQAIGDETFGATLLVSFVPAAT